MKRQSKFLYRNTHGVYYFRMRIPRPLPYLLNSTEIKLSLKTRDLSTALRRRENLRLYLQPYFAEMIVTMEQYAPTLSYELWGNQHTDTLQQAQRKLEKALRLKRHAETRPDGDFVASDPFLLKSDSLRRAKANRQTDIEVCEQIIDGIESAINARLYSTPLFDQLRAGANDIPPAATPVDHQSAQTPVPCVPPKLAPNTHALRLSVMIDDYKRWQIKDGVWTEATLHKTVPKLDLLIEILGDCDVRAIDRTDARLVKGVLPKLPNNSFILPDCRRRIS